MDYLSIFLFVVAIIFIFLLIVSEYVAQDCIPGKKCTHSVPAPTPEDNVETYLEKIRAMVVNNYMFVIWRLSMLAGLIGTIVVVYLLKGRIPTLAEYILVGVILFICTYGTLSWLQFHFIRTNGFKIEEQINILRDRLKISDSKNQN